MGGSVAILAAGGIALIYCILFFSSRTLRERIRSAYRVSLGHADFVDSVNLGIGSIGLALLAMGCDALIPHGRTLDFVLLGFGLIGTLGAVVFGVLTITVLNSGRPRWLVRDQRDRQV
jgi:hypothetical protein